MKKRILKMYGVAAIIFFVMIIYGLLNFRLTGMNSGVQTGFETLVSYSAATVKDETAPRGEKVMISLRMDDVRRDYNTLFFYTIHQNVKVYLDGAEIYRVEPVPSTMMPGSPGRIFNQIKFQEDANGKELLIVLYPLYAADTNPIPELLFGGRYAIIEHIIGANMFTLILCAASISIGVFLLLLVVLGKNETYNRKMLFYLGFFSIAVGVWKAFDCSVFGLLSIQLPVISVIPFFALMLLPVVLVEFLRNAVSEKQTLIWDISDLISIVVMVMILGLQLLGFSDIWQNLWMMQSCLGICILCVAIGLFQLVKRHGWKQNIRQGVICAGCCLVWLLADMVSYYIPQGVSSVPLSMLVFLFFLGLLAMERLRKNREKMAVGMQARQYSKLAFHDALTGFFNKAAYMEHLSNSDFSPSQNVMVTFDLNNLKKCNDELGHDKGDIYIKESAKIIMDCFGEKGRCYRLGGDEFGAILNGASLEDCEKCAERMREKVQRFNANSRDIHMGIACGYAIFDPAEDEDINATIRRADKMMYEVKFRMKQIEA